MKQLLEDSKRQLLNPLGDARRKLLIILNCVYCVLAPVFLISEKVATGNFVNDSLLYLVYGTAIFLNLLSAVYNIYVIKKCGRPGSNYKQNIFLCSKQNALDLFFGYASVLPIMVMNFCNILGVGNPFNDAILTDFALSQSLMIIVVIILGRRAVTVWFIMVVLVLFWNVSTRGWDYEYHYSTPSEILQYKEALSKKEEWALKRKTELETARLNPPKITRYFNTWIVFLIVSFLTAYFFSGITIDIFRIVPTVVANIEQAAEESKKMEMEQKANEERTNTIINLAHETKTPLTLLNNYIDEYIKKHGSNRETEIIKWNVERLTVDILNFFDLERFNKGISIYDHNQVSNLSCILSYKLSLFKCVAKKKNIEILDNVNEDCYVHAHPAALERIVNNLIENSLKYTEETGTISISLFSQNNRIIFIVADNGIGIPRHLHSKIFEPYFQLGINVKSNEGMGIGLSIVKKIIDDLNGEINVQSETNHGTRITVSLPQHIFEEGEVVTDYTVTPSLAMPVFHPVINDKISDPSWSYILIVDDNIEMLNYLIENLQDKYNVYTAIGGMQALVKLQSISQLDLIISDVMMDGVDGFEFCKSVSQNDRFEHIPFIFLTARSTLEDKLKGLRLGAVDYIEKPFMIDHLYSKIQSVLINSEKQRAAFIKKLSTSISPDRRMFKSLSDSERHISTFDANCKRFGLTTREIEITVLLGKGLPYKIVADKLNISIKTVYAHVSKIFSKANVNNKVELINRLNEPAPNGEA